MDSASADLHGQWPSPITAELVADASGGTTWPTCVGDETWWCSSDPLTGAVQVLRCTGEEEPSRVLAGGWSVRNRVNGYGGRPYVVVAAQAAHQLVFTEYSDRGIYRTEVPRRGGTGEEPTPLTPVDPPGISTSYADLVVNHDGREVLAIREVTRDSTGPEDADPAPRTTRDVVAIPLDGSAAQAQLPLRVVATSHHFLSGIRISPDGNRLAWIGWDHPAMPWDGTDLMVAELEAGSVTNVRRVLGDPDTSIPQVEWAGSHTLYAMADPTGWWNLHRIRLDESGSSTVECVLALQEDCADALWKVGSTWFAVTSGGIVLRHGVGSQKLALWDPSTGALRQLAPDWEEFGSAIGGTGDAVAVVAGSTQRSSIVLRVALPTSPGAALAAPLECTADKHRRFQRWSPPAERRIAHDRDGRQVHYVYYPPTNPDHSGPEGVGPPLLIDVHGGPTGSTGATPDLEFALFCSRGFAVASVDYGGSTGYGRTYRNRLRGQWGVVDVADSVTVAETLIAEGLGDADRVAVRGGSAGGWTSLACLASADLFCAGAVYYPISDPLNWAGGETHDFESQYLRSLIGELPADRDRYEAVSPVANAEHIRRPLVMLQGADDTICRPDQAQRIINAVAARGLWHQYLVFPGEGHGFRKASSVAASLRAEGDLYTHTMGITVDLDNTSVTSEGTPAT